MPNILICDDERDIVNALKLYLADPEYRLFEAYSGQEALDVLRREEIHLILLDIMMPGMDGMTALTRIREKSGVPVIFLTAKSEDTDVVLGLNMGADDYITKPFRPLEVTARVRSQLRRYLKLGGAKPENDGNRYEIGGIALDDRSKSVTLDGDEVSRTPTEYEILRLLMQNPGRVFSPKEIYAALHDDCQVNFGSENIIAVHIRHLREKLELDPANPRWLKVVWGHGYKIESGERRGRK